MNRVDGGETVAILLDGWCLCFFSSRRRHTRYWRDWSSDVCSFRSDLVGLQAGGGQRDLGGQRLEQLDVALGEVVVGAPDGRSEERRVGKECRSRGSPYH